MSDEEPGPAGIAGMIALLFGAVLILITIIHGVVAGLEWIESVYGGIGYWAAVSFVGCFLLAVGVLLIWYEIRIQESDSR